MCNVEPTIAVNRNEAVAKLKGCADDVKARGATSLYLFGSAVRDQAEIDSDVDLFIDYDAEKKFSLVPPDYRARATEAAISDRIHAASGPAHA